MKIAVIGKGGREHALVKALKESPSAPEMYCFPGSDAINRLATPIPARDLPSLIDWMVSNKMDLCVAGEESYLVKDEGLANACSRAGIPCWGPVKESAQLEASKEFAKDFLLRHRIPTGQARVAATLEEARQFIGNNYPTVLKFDGLAAGKGVAVCMSKEEADSFLKEVFTDRRFGEGRLLVEEFLPDRKSPSSALWWTTIISSSARHGTTSASRKAMLAPTRAAWERWLPAGWWSRKCWNALKRKSWLRR